MDGPGPPLPPTVDADRSWPILVAGLLLTAALVAAVIAVWPDGGDGATVATDRTQTTEVGLDPPTTSRHGTGEPSQTTGTTDPPVGEPADLFGGDLPVAYAALLAAAGAPAEIIEVAVYDTYAFVAYRDPANPANIDRRMWRDGEVGDADVNPIDDRVDADTQPKLFGPGELDASIIARLVADAPSHYGLPTAVSHVLIDRFLPFDQRVLIRVYASPTDGRSGGGYVSYDTAGAYVGVCC